MTNEGKVYDPKIDQFDGNDISFDKIRFVQRFRLDIIKIQE